MKVTNYNQLKNDLYLSELFNNYVSCLECDSTIGERVCGELASRGQARAKAGVLKLI